MRTNAQARYRHSGKSGHADRRSYHRKAGSGPTWTLEQIEAEMLRKIACGDEFWASYRAKQLVSRLREAGIVSESGDLQRPMPHPYVSPDEDTPEAYERCEAERLADYEHTLEIQRRHEELYGHLYEESDR